MALTNTDPRDHLLLRAIRGEDVPRAPVWAMRQAGRWDPEFQKLRGDLSFFEFSENAELSARASLCPLRFGVDAIILFYDITTLSIAMGQPFQLVAGKGPVPDWPVRSMADVRKLSASPDPERYRHVLETLRLVQQALNGSLPILFFAGAPYTLATYQIGTGKDVDATRKFQSENPEVWTSLLERTTEATISFLKTMFAAGGAAYQLFDSWAGSLTRAEYLVQAQPWHERIFREAGSPSILFVKDGPYLDLMAKSGANVISLGKDHDLSAAITKHSSIVFQGNVDHELLIHGTADEVRAATQACIRAGGGKRHILNLDHGMDRLAKVENFAAFVDAGRLS